MSLSIIYSRAKLGIEAPLVTVETHLSNGLPAFSIVGLPETAVKESKDRVRSAIINSHFEFPARRITINLAPADLPKEGGRFDLPIALGILAASGQIPGEPMSGLEFMGELALTGELRAVIGALPAAVQAASAGRSIVIPTANFQEAALCEQATVLPAKSLLQLSAHLHGRAKLSVPEKIITATGNDQLLDLADVKGQQSAKRALEIAAAGNHHLLFSGPPGTGKTMLASRLPGILPALTATETLDVATIYSMTHQTKLLSHSVQRPFRSPHHTASAVALVGGGSNPQPGEISLAHHGVLFLDELPEFQRKALEVLREPLESGEISISRASQRILFPARFQLVAAMNPCPCGYFGDHAQPCRCSPDQIRRYRNKISGPLLDRIDLQVNVARLPIHCLSKRHDDTENSSTVRQRVSAARDLQLQRNNKTNAELHAKEIEQFCPLDKQSQRLLDDAAKQFCLSPRAYHRILKVARTIADLAGSQPIQNVHLSEAINYRMLDKTRV